MPSSHLNDPEYWRDRAKEARAMAEDMADPASKQKMLEVAASYEHLDQTRRRPREGKNSETFVRGLTASRMRSPLSVPAPSECVHCRVPCCLISVRRRSVLVIPVSQRPHPGCPHRRFDGLKNAPDDKSVAPMTS
jgi:hypothetical protein